MRETCLRAGKPKFANTGNNQSGQLQLLHKRSRRRRRRRRRRRAPWTRAKSETGQCRGHLLLL